MPECDKKPCKECPFRRKSMAGWLGASSPEQFMAATLNDHPMPCHTTVDYEDPKWKEKWDKDVRSNNGDSRYCAGAAIFFANMFKLSRDAKRPRLPEDRAAVFSAPQEFLRYHNAAKVKSWDPDDEGGYGDDEDDRTP